MGYKIEFNCLLVAPSEEVNLSTKQMGDRFTLNKSGERIYPLNIPIEICDEDYKYFGKVLVRRLTIEKDITILAVEVLKVFDEEESRVYTQNFIKPA